MFEILSAFPLGFWAVIALLGGGFYWCILNARHGIGIPAAAVLVTIAAWYVGDALYNDYLNWHMTIFTPNVLATAWWQVALFIASFLLTTPYFHQRINRRYQGRTSQALLMLRNGVPRQFQRGITILLWLAVGIWSILVILAFFRFKELVLYYFCPYLGGYAGPWAFNGIAMNGMDSVYVMASYLQIMVGSIFGVVAALSNNPNTRKMAFVGVFFTWPYFIIDRTRKFMMLIALPGLIVWVLFRVRGGILLKASLLAGFFLLVSAWFGFVVSHRSDFIITDALKSEGFNFGTGHKEKQQGLNMLEELSWVIKLTRDGAFSPNWGWNYFANLSNPIPRLLWPGKPTIGLDYAAARGLGGGDSVSGVYATMSTGVIGQGVVNFGLYTGSVFAAMLASLWACWLARLDLDAHKIGYLLLYSLGLVMTFNLGRDITFLELYPFIFGFCICWWLNRHYSKPKQSRGHGRLGKRSRSRRDRQFLQPL